MNAIIKKYKSVILYLIFGVLTTCVNVAIYWAAAHVCMLHTVVSTAVAWIAAVLFAYLTNRKWVFKSTAVEKMAVIREIVSFFACRLATGAVDLVCMFLLVDLLHFNDVFIKVGSNILVIALNYVASKLLIFKKGKDT